MKRFAFLVKVYVDVAITHFFYVFVIATVTYFHTHIVIV